MKGQNILNSPYVSIILNKEIYAQLQFVGVKVFFSQLALPLC